MSDIKSAGSNFFRKQAAATLPAQTTPSNAFNAIFGIQKLDDNEEQKIEKLLVEDFRPSETTQEEDVIRDVEDLKKITAEAKGISKQSVYLLGERISKAREILKNYGDGRGAFTKWLQMTFGSRSSAYNCLCYYELYESLPRDDLRIQLKKMPYKAAYALAARGGSIETKAEIISEHHQQKSDEILPIIHEKLPLPKDSRAKTADVTTILIRKISKDADQLVQRKECLTDTQKAALRRVAETILSLIEEPMPIS